MPQRSDCEEVESRVSVSGHDRQAAVALVNWKTMEDMVPADICRRLPKNMPRRIQAV